jgi:hypothetical protein
MSRDEETIVQVFNEYVETFRTLEPRSVASYFHMPCMFIAPRGVRVMTNPTEVESLVAGIMSALKAAIIRGARSPI